MADESPLRARQNDQRGELVAIADGVADVRVVQAEHTAILAEHSAALDDVRTVQAEHTGTLAEHSTALDDVRTVQREHSATLTQLSGSLIELSADVATLTGGFDALTGILNGHGRLLGDILRRLDESPGTH